jgi:hypothetical protein
MDEIWLHFIHKSPRIASHGTEPPRVTHWKRQVSDMNRRTGSPPRLDGAALGSRQRYVDLDT